MSGVDMQSLQKLRNETGLGFSTCKNALVEAENDYDKAVRILREKGVSMAQKKSGREVNDGLCGFASNGKSASLIKVSCETDFVARGDKFVKLVSDVSEVALSSKSKSKEDLLNAQHSCNSIERVIADGVASIGENIVLADACYLSVEKGCVVTYIHNKSQLNDKFGQICVAVVIESDGSEEKLKELGSKLAMQIAANNPQFLNVESVDKTFLDSEREIYKKQMADSGKPANIIEKIIDGKVSAMYKECVLLEQQFIMDNKMKVSEFITSFEKENGISLKVSSFKRYAIK